MARKRTPTDEEIEALSGQFLSMWKQDDVVRTWFRQHRDTLHNLVHGGSSWAAIAEALTQAGITYRTGKPWTAKWLRSDFSRANAPLKGYAMRKPLPKPEQDIQIAAVRAKSKPTITPVMEPQDDDVEPEFKLARFIDWDERRGRDSAVQIKSEPEPPKPSLRYVEIMEQLTGKKPSG